MNQRPKFGLMQGYQGVYYSTIKQTSNEVHGSHVQSNKHDKQHTYRDAYHNAYIDNIYDDHA